MTIVTRHMPLEELTPHRVAEIDVSEHGDVVYIYADGDLTLTHEEWARPPHTDAELQCFVDKWLSEIRSGGAALGAFDGDRLVGIAVVRYCLTETMAQLTALFVSRGHRRRGVARRLTQEASRLARSAGAAHLYVSATPSRSAVGFYQSQGFHLADQVNRELYELEPEDIHMVRAL
jgi:ribosomal protein S18 acetylase RimI-like enzyme